MRLLFLLLAVVTLPTFALPDEVILFRHAEKQAGKNPHLTVAGRQRAQRLATMLLAKKPQHLYSTDFNRTRETIAPLAKLSNKQVTIYDYKDLQGFAEQVKSLSGVVIIAGHSNTTPTLVKLLADEKVSMTENDFSDVFLVSYKDQSNELTRLSSD
ncbi:histidine phosphatase family protein [Pseudoalteromonas sp. T1lg65]|uniref:histidine phosphatase family protein n=1 Tax=Pseudoalteromonas sp. T1lg65 TaxID=2077101 RepID=UPI003F7AE82D